MGIGNWELGIGNWEEYTFMHGGEKIFIGTALFIKSSPTGGDCHPLQMKETGKILFPPASCLAAFCLVS
ncbi:MAG: hypothetical protein F6K47_37820 [Symploca sp. SIO2E6]|nr:hypothetical protein [Symploca sp. SIO2E6]